MHRQAGCALAVVAGATCLWFACAADPGDASKVSSAQSGGSTSSGSSGAPSSSSAGSSGGTSSGTGSSSGQTGSSTGSPGGSSSSGGGTSSGVGSSGVSTSSSGAGGSSSGGPSCSPAANPQVAVSYCTNDSTNLTATQTISFNLQLANNSFKTTNLSDVTVRYWFSADGNAPTGLVFVSYYSQNGNSAITADVKGTFASAPAANTTPTSDSYLELSFTSDAGSLGQLGSGSAAIQAAIHGPNYTGTFNETNDYSFTATSKCSTYVQTQTVTAYVAGALVWGCEPGAGGASSSSSSGAASSSGADSGGGADAPTE